MGVEQELIEATGFNPRKPFKNRQDHLTALIKEVDGLDEPEYKQLSDEATTWANEAVAAYKAKEEIPDFEDGEEATDHEAAEAAADDAGETGEAGDADADAKGDGREAPEEAPAKPKTRTKTPVSKKAKAKAVKAEETEEAEEAEPAPKPKKQTKAPAAADIEVDEFDVIIGTKTHDALMMFKKGATTADVKDTVGGTYYNILKRLASEGHLLEKDGPFIKLTHKDSIPKGKAKKK